MEYSVYKIIVCAWLSSDSSGFDGLLVELLVSLTKKYMDAKWYDTILGLGIIPQRLHSLNWKPCSDES